MTTIKLPYGKSSLTVALPEDAHVARPQERQPQDALACIEGALANPIGTKPLTQLLSDGASDMASFTAAIIIDDITRSTPTAMILPLLLKALQGVPPKNISIVIALGTHRPLTVEELEIKIGKSVLQGGYNIVNTSSNENMVYLGTSKNNIPAYVKQEVATASLKIGIGQIMPHMDAGYSGGAKIILPGVCSTKTVEKFHEQEVYVEDNLLGNLNSPIRRDMEQFVEECVGLDFIVNVIMTADHQLYQCVAGHFIKAHRAGVDHVNDLYGVRTKKFPIVVANAYPKDIDLWQSTTGLAAGERMVEEGGTLILLTNAWDKHSAYPDFPERIGEDPASLKERFDSLANKMTAIFGIVVGRYKKKFHISLVSQGLTRGDADTMGFTFYATVEEAIEAAQKRKISGQVAVLTHGGITLPLVEQS